MGGLEGPPKPPDARQRPGEAGRSSMEVDMRRAVMLLVLVVLLRACVRARRTGWGRS